MIVLGAERVAIIVSVGEGNHISLKGRYIKVPWAAMR